MSNVCYVAQNEGRDIFIQTKPSTKHDDLKKPTHLFMHDKYLQHIGDLSAYGNLIVLYLHNNFIQTIRNLNSLWALKHLYLQKNNIKKIEGLGSLKNLRKLYLGCNEISVVEGLEKLINLEELHIEKQRLNKGESLCFDPRSIVNIAETLLILNISHNNLTSIEGIEPLLKLRNLNASYNQINDVQNTAKSIQNWFYLTELNFIGNPMTKQHRYKDTLIVNTLRLVILDNKDINETTRSFIKRFDFEKTQNKMNSLSKISIMPKNMPGSVAPTLQKAVSKSVIQNLSKSTLKTTLSADTDIYVPWNALKPTVSDSGKVIPPLFLKHQMQKSPEMRKVHFSQLPQIF